MHVGESALLWASKCEANNCSAQFANIAIIWAQLMGKFEVNEASFIPGTSMGDIDHGSRGRPTPSLPPDLFFDIEACPGFLPLLTLCDPSINSHTINYHEAFTQVHFHLLAFLEHIEHSR